LVAAFKGVSDYTSFEEIFEPSSRQIWTHSLFPLRIHAKEQEEKAELRAGLDDVALASKVDEVQMAIHSLMTTLPEKVQSLFRLRGVEAEDDSIESLMQSVSTEDSGEDSLQEFVSRMADEIQQDSAEFEQVGNVEALPP